MNALQVFADVSCRISLASEFLILARVKAQEAVVLQEAWNNEVSDAEIRRGVTSLRQTARRYRLYAREELIKAEKLNGKLYCNGEDWMPLREGLGGRDFRKWTAYKNVYARSKLFKGVDPN